MCTSPENSLTAHRRGPQHPSALNSVKTAAFEFNDSGNFNTATGASAVLNHTTGDRNTAVGTQALFTDGGGAQNTAIGYQALFSSTTIGGNTGSV